MPSTRSQKTILVGLLLSALNSGVLAAPACAQSNSDSLKVQSIAQADLKSIAQAAAQPMIVPDPHSNLKERPARVLLPDTTIETLSASDRELAEQLEIWDMLRELHNRQNPPSETRKETLRTKIRETIMESYLDAVSVQSEANREHGVIDALRERVMERRERSVDLNNATNFIASGTLNTVGSVLGFTNKLPPFPGNVNQMLSGVVSTGMSTYALKQASGGKTKGQGNPTLMAELFGRPVDSRTSIPESVWRFLHGHSIDKPDKSRLQVLEEEWIEHKHLEPHGSPREQLKIDLICGVSMPKKLMTVDDLNDQISMISELGGMVARMTRHLRNLLRLIDTDLPD